MKIAEKIARLRLIRSNTIGPITFLTLIKRYGSALEAIDRLPELTRRSNVRVRLTTKTMIEDEMASLEKIGGWMIVRGEDSYPASLDAFDDAPGCLSVIGHTPLLHRPAVSIVGSRNSSANAMTFCEQIATELGEHGFVVASGLARGIDAAAHLGGLAGGTIAVLGGGVDQIYPRENEKLYQRVCAEGVVISEMPFGMQPLARHFPIRNRIIASLSLATLVVEAGLKSGSLITAQEASDRGREVLAVPGIPLDPRSYGCNDLIRDGAVLIRNIDDILEVVQDYDMHAPDPKSVIEAAEPSRSISPEDLTHAHAELRKFLSFDPIEVDELIRRCHLSASVVNVALLEMELAGVVTRLYGNRVTLTYEKN
ncbi:DNA-processing protein DprA [Alphaproteobacteria bacterium LSUCC0684]